MNLHDLIKFYKHGFSKITDHLTREIRFKRIEKKKALKIVKFFENRTPHHIDLFCNWLSIDQKSLWFILDFYRNKKFWKQKDIFKWSFNGWSNNNFIFDKEKKINKKLFFINNSILKKNSDYIVFGKGI
jgi:hypothetical protein